MVPRLEQLPQRVRPQAFEQPRALDSGFADPTFTGGTQLEVLGRHPAIHRRRAPQLPLDPRPVARDEGADLRWARARRSDDLNRTIAEHAHRQATGSDTAPHPPVRFDGRICQQGQLPWGCATHALTRVSGLHHMVPPHDHMISGMGYSPAV